MDYLTFLFRVLTAVVAPAAAVSLSIWAILQVKQTASDEDQREGQCLRCDEIRLGSDAKFYYAANLGSARDIARGKTPANNPSQIIGEERHFICNDCARRYIHHEVIQQIAMALIYPAYLVFGRSLLASSGFFANFLLETFLAVLSFSSAIAAIDLFRGVKGGRHPIDEAKDRVAIGIRRRDLGKGYDYYTRLGRHKIDLP